METELPLAELAGRLGVAALAGMIIGLEREWRQKPAGLRTNIRIGDGAALGGCQHADIAAAIEEMHGGFLPAAPHGDVGRSIADRELAQLDLLEEVRHHRLME
jgi:hypothetical protein